MAPSSTILAAPAPSGVRYRVLAFTCALSMITYLDRVCFGTAAPEIAAELSLESVADLKWAFTAFAIAYAVFEIPSGWLGDVWGPRGTLIRIVIWWSICTALTGVIGLRVGGVMLGGLGMLILLRFLFGMGEAGAYPNITRALHNWFPATEHSTAQGWIWMSGRLMGGITPLLWLVLVAGTSWTSPLMNWRGAFLLFGIVGVLWCVAFGAFFRNRPAEHRGVNAQELALIEQGRKAAPVHGGVPWSAFLLSGNLWLLCLMYFCMVYGWYFHVTYLPAYLRDRFQVSDQSLLGAIYKGSPLWLGAFGCLAGGYLVDALIRRSGDRARVRRWVGFVSQALCALCWVASLFAPNVHFFIIAIASAAMLNDFTLASTWATCQDIGQRYAGITAAWMNTVGTLGAAVAGWLTGTLMEWSLARSALAHEVPVELLSSSAKTAAILEGYNHGFVTYAAVYAISALCWVGINAAKPIIATHRDK